MALPTALAESAVRVLAEVRGYRILRSELQQFITDASGGPVGFQYVMDVYKKILITRDSLLDSKSVAGIDDAAKVVLTDPLLAWSAEVDAVAATITASATTIRGEIPKESQSGQGYLNAHSFDGEILVERTGAPGATAGVRAALQAVIDAFA